MNVLFMCVANSARSQLAEGLARHLLPGSTVESAGSRPGKLNPYAVAVMHEIGIDISGHHSKSVDDLSQSFLSGLDYAITLCAEEVCPTLSSRARKLHWPLPDPVTQEPLSEEEMLRRFRDAREAISKHLHELMKEMNL